jgi:hypothetical protein
MDNSTIFQFLSLFLKKQILLFQVMNISFVDANIVIIHSSATAIVYLLVI